MGVDRNRGLAERRIENDVGGLSTDTRQRFERLALIGNLATVLFHQNPAGGDQVFSLVVIQADGFDVFL